MVNYCCVLYCGRNSKQNKHLNFYSLPKDKRRQEQWLQAAGREHLLQTDKALVSYRFCSLHFPPSAIKNKHLCDTAVPSLCLPGTYGEIVGQHSHKGIICDNCGQPIQGFRYKCVTCEDFDLCQKCEMRETHREHYMLRMPKPLKFKLADNLAQKWQSFFNANHATPTSDTDERGNSDSDDEPITKYVRNYDSGLDLTEEVKRTIRDEVTRVLAIPEDRQGTVVSKKRTGDELKKPIKRIKMDGTIGSEDRAVPEVVFADVNVHDHLLEIKHEALPTEDQALVHVKLSDDLSEFMIEMTPQQTNNDGK